MIERFVNLLYVRASACLEIIRCWRDLFTQKGRSFELLPPTKDALKQHTLGALLQTL